MTMLEAKHVQLHGSMTVAGMNTREISPLRDGCELHLHQETGGVYVQRDGQTTYLSPLIIAAVELTHPLSFGLATTQEPPKARPPRAHPIVAQAEQDEGPKDMTPNLADDALAELTGSPVSKSVRKPRAASVKRA